MMEDLAMALSGDGDDDARDDAGPDFRPPGLAVIRFDDGLAETAHQARAISKPS